MNIVPTPIGEFNKRITVLKRNVNITNELGETVPSSKPDRKVWAKIKPLQSVEILENAENISEVTHEIRMRYCTDITSADAFEYKGRIFDISERIDIMEQHIELLFKCKEQRL